MINRFSFAGLTILLLLCACTSFAQRSSEPEQTGELIGKRIIFTDGATLDVDDAWKQGDTFWYRVQGTSQSVRREVRKIENRYKEITTTPATAAPATKTVEPKTPPPAPATYIYLTDGARLRVDEVREVSDGAWYNRGSVAIFIERERIARIEREPDAAADSSQDWKLHGWTSGN